MKKILIILLSIIIIGYLIFSVIFFGKSSKEEVCERFEVIIKDSTDVQFVTEADIVNLVKYKEMYPVGKKIEEINTLAIRDTIMRNKLVETAKVYHAQEGIVVASITQRKPILRVISDIKGNFYIDNKQEYMPISSNFAVYVPIATGSIDEDFAKNELFDFAMFLQENPDWDAWIEQIVVKPNKEIELIPRMGDFKIAFGKLEKYPEKLAKFALFIEKGLNTVGWNRYSEINLKYDNQVVCTKK